MNEYAWPMAGQTLLMRMILIKLTGHNTHLSSHLIAFHHDNLNLRQFYCMDVLGTANMYLLGTVSRMACFLFRVTFI